MHFMNNELGQNSEDKSRPDFVGAWEIAEETQEDGGKTASTKITVKTPSPEADFEFDNDTGTITGYIGPDKDIVIPAKIGEVTVKAIGRSAFSFNNVRSITIPNSVMTIGNYAFLSNNLRSITIPNSVTTIGKGAFNDNKLPEEQAFIYGRKDDGSENNTKIVSYGGEKREDVIIPDSVTTVVADAFSSNELKSLTIPNSVETIGDYAFSFNNLRSLTIPDSVTTVGDYAFSSNDLTSITIPNSVTTIGKGALNDNKLPEEQAFIYGRKDDGSENNTKIVSYGGEKREDVIIPDSVTTIGDCAFDANHLRSLTIPDSVTTIGDYAFRFNHLRSITIPDSVTTIGKEAFSSNDLTSITIANSVTTIGKDAFIFNKLTSITIPNSVTTIGDDAFSRNGLERNSGDIPRPDFVGAWEIAEDTTEWTRKE